MKSVSGQKEKLNIYNYSPSTMVGSTFTHDDDEFFAGPEEELTVSPEFFLFDDDSYNNSQSSTSAGSHQYFSNQNSIQWQRIRSNSQTQIDFTLFLERLDSAFDKQMMDLLARCFHDRITVFKNNVKIFNINEDYSNLHTNTVNINAQNQNQVQVQNESDFITGTRVVVSIDLENKASPQIVRDFIEEADDLLDNRQDLKLALRAVFPPTIAAAGYADPIFSSPMARSKERKQRKAARNNRISATIAALYGNDNYDEFDNKRSRKRGRPRKNTFDSNFNGRLDNDFKKLSKGNGFDDEWKPEKKRAKHSKKSDLSEGKKSNKLKTPSDKAKEEADLAGMGIEKLEKHILSLQNQMRNVKHKHRKGTICPRCTTEQRLKLAYKAKARAQCEIKVLSRSPMTPRSEVLISKPRSAKPVLSSNITPPVTRPKPLSVVAKATMMPMYGKEL